MRGSKRQARGAAGGPAPIPPRPSASPLREAESLLAARRFEAAEALLSTLAQGLDPTRAPRESAQVHRLQAIAAMLQQQPPVALRHALQAALVLPDDAQVQFALGRAHKLADQLPAALAAYRRAVELEPAFAEAWVSLGIALKHGGDVDGAIDCYRRAIAIRPSLGVAHANLGNALARQAELASELGSFETPGEALMRAAEHALELDPHNPALHRNHGALLLAAHRRQEAADAYNRALGLEPTHVECCLRLGHCLVALGGVSHGIELYRRWLGTNRPAAPVMRALANLLTREGQADEALRWAEQAAALDPDPTAWMQLCFAYQQVRRLDEAVEAGRRAIALAGGQARAYPITLMAMCYASDDARAVHALHTEYGRALPPPQPRPVRAPTAGRRLRVGYVSGDFVRHSVAYFVAPLLEHHDREAFEVHLFHNRGWGDAVTERLRSLGHRWHECEGVADDALAWRMADLELDAIVDLSGHTAHSRLPLLARRVAPVQITYLGYPTVSGVPAIDFRITDAAIDPGDMPHGPGDRPLVLPRSMFCYRPEDAVAVGPPPSDKAGGVCFGSFNNVAKLSDRTLALWARVLGEVPGSRLLLKAAAMAETSNRDGITGFIAAHGVAADRLELVARIPDKGGHLDLYNRVDVALDPTPYNGATTSCEALWMGVPVVTLRGATHAARMGASILGAAGRGDWIADDEDAYVRLARRLADDRDQRARWRAGARAQLDASELRDERGFARAFEDALRRACAWAEGGAGAADDAMADPPGQDAACEPAGEGAHPVAAVTAPSTALEIRTV